MSIFRFVFFALIIFNSVQGGSSFTAITVDSNEVVAQRNQESWLGADKAVHLVGSMIVTVGSGIILQKTKRFSQNQSACFGLGFSFALGVGKEYSDSRQRNNHFSYKDLTANIIGSIVGTVLLLQE